MGPPWAYRKYKPGNLKIVKRTDVPTAIKAIEDGQGTGKAELYEADDGSIWAKVTLKLNARHQCGDVANVEARRKVAWMRWEPVPGEPENPYPMSGVN